MKDYSKLDIPAHAKGELISSLQEISFLLQGVEKSVSILANAASYIYYHFENNNIISWVGFYLFNEAKQELYLGPFQGKVACEIIPLGKGVCGNAALEKKTIVVDDVHKFKGHIACDALSASEIVIPLVKEGKLIGVLDIDSYAKDTFKDYQAYFEEIANIIVENIKENLC